MAGNVQPGLEKISLEVQNGVAAEVRRTLWTNPWVPGGPTTVEADKSTFCTLCKIHGARSLTSVAKLDTFGGWWRLLSHFQFSSAFDSHGRSSAFSKSREKFKQKEGKICRDVAALGTLGHGHEHSEIQT